MCGTDKRLRREAIAEQASLELGNGYDTTKTELVRATLGLVGSTRRQDIRLPLVRLTRRVRMGR